MAVATLRESDFSWVASTYGLRGADLIWQGMAEALRGEANTAERALEDAQRTNRSRARLYDADWARARAWMLVAGGKLTDSERAGVEATGVAVGGDRWTYEVLALHDLARFQGLRVGPRRPPPWSAGSRSSPTGSTASWPRRCAAHAQALAAGDGVALDAAADTFAELGFDLFAAEAQAAAARPRRRRPKARFHASAERARRLAAACVGATTPLLRRLGAAGQPGDLTRREREIAELAARGHTDREIAEMLYLSVRTVHAHLRSRTPSSGSPAGASWRRRWTSARTPGANRYPTADPLPRALSVPWTHERVRPAPRRYTPSRAPCQPVGLGRAGPTGVPRRPPGRSQRRNEQHAACQNRMN